GADRIKARRRHPALVRAEMMLDAERMVEAELIAQSKLAPELLVARVRRHAGFCPDVGEMGKFHGTTLRRACAQTLPLFADRQGALDGVHDRHVEIEPAIVPELVGLPL